MPETSTARPRVVVTGMGAVTSQGASLADFWDGVSHGRVAIREVAHMPMDGYRTRLGGEVVEQAPPAHSYLNPDGFHDRAIDFTIRAAEEAMANCGVGVGPIPAERWGVVIGTCNAGLLAGEEWYRRRKQGETPDPKLVLLVEPQAMAEALSGAFDLRGPVLSVDTACAASANADRLRRRADPKRPRGRGADGWGRRLLGHPLRRLQLAGVALAGARSSVLARPQRPLPRRGQRHAGADARGSRAGARGPRAGRDPRLRPLRRRLPPHRPPSRGPRRGARDPAPRSHRAAWTPGRSAMSTATAPAPPRTTRRRPPRRRSASARRLRATPRSARRSR